MKDKLISEMSIKELVDRFAKIGVAQDVALLGGEIAKFSRLFEQMRDVSNELKGRENDQRHALLALFDFPNIQVRLKAAKHALKVAPIEARRQIETIAGSEWFPQAGEAGMCLALLDDGTFQPT